MRERKRERERTENNCLSINRARVWPTNRYISRSSIAVAYTSFVCHHKAKHRRLTINIGKVKWWKRINKCRVTCERVKKRDRALRIFEISLLSFLAFLLQKMICFFRVPIIFYMVYSTFFEVRIICP